MDFFTRMKSAAWMIGLIVLLAVTADAADPNDRSPGSPGEKMTESRLNDVLKEQTKELMSFPGVVGTALGACEGRPCSNVYVVQRTPELDRKIFNQLAGYPVQIEETGPMEALPKKRD